MAPRHLAQASGPGPPSTYQQQQWSARAPTCRHRLLLLVACWPYPCVRQQTGAPRAATCIDETVRGGRVWAGSHPKSSSGVKVALAAIWAVPDPSLSLQTAAPTGAQDRVPQALRCAASSPVHAPSVRATATRARSTRVWHPRRQSLWSTLYSVFTAALHPGRCKHRSPG